jgi:hypothetical protein
MLKMATYILHSSILYRRVHLVAVGMYQILRRKATSLTALAFVRLSADIDPSCLRKQPAPARHLPNGRRL